MKKLKPITVPALVKELTPSAITLALGCERSTPCKWAKGQRPGWKHLDALEILANKRGYTLNVIGVQK